MNINPDEEVLAESLLHEEGTPETELCVLRLQLEQTRVERDRLREQVAWLNTNTHTEHSMAPAQVSPSSARIVVRTFLENAIQRVVEALDKGDEELEDGFHMVESSERAFSLNELRDNVSRLRAALSPFFVTADHIQSWIGWESPLVTLNVMTLYFMLVYYRLVPVAFLSALLVFFAATYLEKSGWNICIFHYHEEGSRGAKEEDISEMGLRERIAAVRSGALKAQTVTGDLADSLEKVINFCMWEDYEGARLLVKYLLMACVGLLLVPVPVLDRLVFGYLGLVVFVKRPLYTMFPHLKRRYDDIHRIWSRLPTHRVKAFRLSQEPPSSTSPLRQTGSDASSDSNPDPQPSLSVLVQGAEVHSPSVKRLLSAHGLGDEQLVEAFREGVKGYLTVRTYFALPRLIAGRLYLTTGNSLVFAAKFLPKHSFVASLEDVRRLERSQTRAGLLSTLTVFTKTTVATITGIVQHDKLEALCDLINANISLRQTPHNSDT